MCGITGVLAGAAAPDVLLETVQRMASALRDRGPDDDGAWVDREAPVALGHRRLAVIDLSQNGHQPMVSACGRYAVSFNGEIYNFIDLRRELETYGHRFCGGSDTEVLLAAFTQWGIDEAIPRLDGMFAFGVWDRDARVLTLARDRLGEKPIYYGWAGSQLLFASDLRAIERHPAFSAAINQEALALYFRYGYIPAPHSVYQHFYKLPHGCAIRFRPTDAHCPGTFSPFADDGGSMRYGRPTRYWSVWSTAQRGLSAPFDGSEAEAEEALHDLVYRAVASRRVADVPLGALLSGGTDSSLITAMLQAQSTRPVRTFTIGFREQQFDEAADARAIARHLGTDHTELHLEPHDALGLIEQLPGIYDEPFADASQVPTTLVSRLVRQHVTVALSGDGGDELFGGYRRYIAGRSIWNRVAWIPARARHATARLLRGPSGAQWDAVARHLPFIPKAYGTYGTAGDKFHKLAEVLSMTDSDALYERLVTIGWTDAAAVLTAVTEPPPPRRANGLPTSDVVTRMMFMDLDCYLPDDILTKVDRASMSASLELRVPLLDHHVVEFAWALPPSMKLAAGESKRVLRRVLHRYFPKHYFEKPKRGFGVPIGAWLRGPLREWADSLLAASALERHGLLRVEEVRTKWMEHLSGVRNWENHLWAVLMFQSWFESRSRQASEVSSGAR